MSAARPMLLPGAVLLCAVLCSACSGIDEQVRDSAETVLTLRSGTLTDLRRQTGSGPYTRYELPPEEMLDVVAEAARKARGKGDRPVSAIFVSEFRREVVAKERPPDEADDDGYAAPFLSAMLVNVWPVRGAADVSRVEIHAIRSGPFHKGSVAWVRDMPGWIEEVLEKRRSVAAAPLQPIPEERLKPIP